MEFLNLLKRRCSVRDYEKKEVEQALIDQILEAARVAPSACNKQPIRIKVIQKEGLTKLNQVYSTFGASLAFLICADRTQAWVRRYDGKNSADIDASIVCDHMMLTSTVLGLDSVWVCAFDPEKMKETFSLPEQIEPINLLVCGYGKAGTKKKDDRHDEERKALRDILID